MAQQLPFEQNAFQAVHAEGAPQGVNTPFTQLVAHGYDDALSALDRFQQEAVQLEDFSARQQAGYNLSMLQAKADEELKQRLELPDGDDDSFYEANGVLRQNRVRDYLNAYRQDLDKIAGLGITPQTREEIYWKTRDVFTGLTGNLIARGVEKQQKIATDNYNNNLKLAMMQQDYPRALEIVRDAENSGIIIPSAADLQTFTIEKQANTSFFNDLSIQNADAAAEWLNNGGADATHSPSEIEHMMEALRREDDQASSAAANRAGDRPAGGKNSKEQTLSDLNQMARYQEQYEIASQYAKDGNFFGCRDQIVSFLWKLTDEALPGTKGAPLQQHLARMEDLCKAYDIPSSVKTNLLKQIEKNASRVMETPKLDLSDRFQELKNLGTVKLYRQQDFYDRHTALFKEANDAFYDVLEKRAPYTVNQIWHLYSQKDENGNELNSQERWNHYVTDTLLPGYEKMNDDEKEQFKRDLVGKYIASRQGNIVKELTANTELRVREQWELWLNEETFRNDGKMPTLEEQQNKFNALLSREVGRKDLPKILYKEKDNKIKEANAYILDVQRQKASQLQRLRDGLPASTPKPVNYQGVITVEPESWNAPAGMLLPSSFRNNLGDDVSRFAVTVPSGSGKRVRLVPVVGYCRDDRFSITAPAATKLRLTLSGRLFGEISVMQVDAGQRQYLEDTYGSRNPAPFLRKSPESGLSAYDSEFEKAGSTYGVDPDLLRAIAMHETGNGTSKAFKEKRNAMGISPNGGGPRRFSSVEESIDYAARLLRSHYLDKGLVTIEAIGRKYAPEGAGNDPHGLNKDWVRGVTSYYRQLKAGRRSQLAAK